MCLGDTTQRFEMFLLVCPDLKAEAKFGTTFLALQSTPQLR